MRLEPGENLSVVDESFIVRSEHAEHARLGHYDFSSVIDQLFQIRGHFLCALPRRLKETLGLRAPAILHDSAQRNRQPQLLKNFHRCHPNIGILIVRKDVREQQDPGPAAGQCRRRPCLFAVLFVLQCQRLPGKSRESPALVDTGELLE
ncbi:MAG: hypothetical protein B7Z63_06045 [Ignavibacteriae bacterium 37-53-5]|nr:MAG: hypothetical protein B7Z63_06045 [Ignavibacteriae bacterium 37-53-5]